MKTHLMIALMALAVTASAGEVPFGHADWRASPTDPVGFAGQGNNWFPGATPPTTWSLGVDGKGRNIRWTVPIPGWTDAQPLVVGPSTGSGQARIVGVYSPHYVVCYDADTGKVLWQDELKLMTLPERGEVGKSAGAAPDPAKAAVLQTLFERGLALTRMEYVMKAGVKEKEWASENLGQIMAPRLPLFKHVVGVLTQWRNEMPDQAKNLDEVVSAFNEAMAGNWKAYAKDRRLITGRSSNSSFGKSVEAACRIRLQSNWQGSVSDVMASPVSDGDIVAVALGFGQVAAYELATGKRLWAWRDPELNPGSVSHCASPCLWKDLVLVPAAGDPKKGLLSILGVDKRTGVVRWETLDNNSAGGNSKWGMGNTHGLHMSPYLMRLPGGKPLLVSNMGNLIDPETGASLGELPRTASGKHDHGAWGTGFIASSNGTLFKGWEGGGPINAWPLSLGADGKVVVTDPPLDPEYLCQGGNSSNPFALSDRLLAISSGFLDPATGKMIWDSRKGGGRLGVVSIAGRRLLGAQPTSPHQTKKDNRWIVAGSPPVAQLTTAVWDIAAPSAPKLLGKNVLTIGGFTPDISAKHFPKAAELYPTADMIVNHSNYQGIGFNFATDTSGITMHGSRLYLHSPAHLICIGEK